MYTFKQAAELAGIHENTARTYRDRFPEFFTWTGEGRRRRYAESTVSLLKFIGEKVAQNLTQEQIQVELEREYGIFINTITQENNITAQEENNSTITPVQFAELVRIAVAKELQSRDAQIIELKAELQESRKAIEALINERDKEILALIREAMAEKKKSWWQFWK